MDALLANCPAGYEAYPGLKYQYRVAAAPATWQLAEDDCRDDTAEAITHLPLFTDAPQLDVFSGYFFNVDPSPFYLFAGYARDQVGGPFRGVTGAVIPAELWEQNEPNNLGGVETVTAVERESRRLEDVRPDLAKPYVCVCDGRTASETFNL
jgi:hypothetical protein